MLVVWAFLGGGLSGFTLYFFLGKVLHVSLRRLGSRGSFRRARHLLAFATAPVALALFVYWPVRIAIYGEDLFRFDGSDGGTTGTVFAWIFYVFLRLGARPARHRCAHRARVDLGALDRRRCLGRCDRRGASRRPDAALRGGLRTARARPLTSRTCAPARDRRRCELLRRTS